MGKKDVRQDNGYLNSLKISRLCDPASDIKELVLRFASSILLEKGIAPDKLKTHLPALYHSVVIRHPLYEETVQSYAKKHGHKIVPLDQLALSIDDESIQADIIELTKALVAAEEQYLASANTVQQIASDMLDKNIRSMRKAGVEIRRHIRNEAIKAALVQHDEYLEALGNTEKLIQTALNVITQEKNGSESSVESCNILTNALKKSMKQRRREGKAFDGKGSKKQKSFLKKLKAKFSKQAIQDAFIVSFLPDIYEAIQPGITDAQMQAIVDLAAHYIKLNHDYVATRYAFGALEPAAMESLIQGGVKLQSPYDYVMAVAYDPMQMAANYFSEQFDDYLQPLYAAKNAVNAVVGAAYTAANVVASPFTYVAGFLFGYNESYFSSLSKNILLVNPPLTESAYVHAMAFYKFLTGLDNELVEDKEKLFKHYFSQHAVKDEDKLTFEQYTASESVLSEIHECYVEGGQLNLNAINNTSLISRTLNKPLLAAIARVNELHRQLSGSISREEMAAIVEELNQYFLYFKDQPFFEKYLSAQLHLMIPLVYERFLVPFIYRLVDEKVIIKGDKDYPYLGGVLRRLQKKQLISVEDVGRVISLASKDSKLVSNAKYLGEMVATLSPWMQSVKTMPVDITKSLMNKSVVTAQRAVQKDVETMLNLIRPTLILEAVVAHLDVHIKKCEQLQHMQGDLAAIYQAKRDYCVAIKSILEAVLTADDFKDNASLAKALAGVNFNLPVVRSPSKREMAKLLLRVADEFGPVTDGDTENAMPLVEKVMNFVINTIDNDAVTQAYQTLSDINTNRNALMAGRDNDSLDFVWFDDESIDPFDMSTQGSHIVRAVVKRYLDTLINNVIEGSGLDSMINHFSKIPGFEFVATQLSVYFKANAAAVYTKEKVLELVCQLIGVQAHTNVGEQLYSIRLSHVFFKVMAMRALPAELSEKIQLTGLAANDELEKMQADLVALQTWAESFSFKPDENPKAIAEKLVEDNDALREYKIQLLLTHCEYLRKYAACLSDESRRAVILVNIAEALGVLAGRRSNELTVYQVEAVHCLRDACEAGKAVELESAIRGVKNEVCELSVDVKSEQDGVARRDNQERTPLYITSQVLGYFSDIATTAYAVYSLVAPVLACVAAIKALSIVSFQTVSLAIGSAFIATPIGLAVVAARFVVSIAWQAYECRFDFRDDWVASQSNLGKAGVIAKYALLVLGRGFLATFLSAALVDTAVALIKKVKITDSPLVRLIQDKLNAKPKQKELGNIQSKLQELQQCFDTLQEASFKEKVKVLKRDIGALQYYKDKAETWKAQLDTILNKRKDVLRLAGRPELGLGHAQIENRLEQNPPAPLAAPAPVYDWHAFAEASASGVGVLQFSGEAKPRQRLPVGSLLAHEPAASVIPSSIFAASLERLQKHEAPTALPTSEVTQSPQPQ